MFCSCLCEFPAGIPATSEDMHVTLGILSPLPLTEARASELESVPGCCTVPAHCSSVTINPQGSAEYVLSYSIWRERGRMDVEWREKERQVDVVEERRGGLWEKVMEKTVLNEVCVDVCNSLSSTCCLSLLLSLCSSPSLQGRDFPWDSCGGLSAGCLSMQQGRWSSPCAAWTCS